MAFWPKRNFESEIAPELPVLYRVARRMGAGAEESEDLVQTTLLKAYEAWDRFDGRHLRSWLIRILRNERMMAARGTTADFSLDESTGFEVADEPFWNELSWRLAADRVLDELERLPESYRLTLHLCDVEQLTYQEVASTLNIPIGTVRSRLFRARMLLRQRLAPLDGQIDEVLA